MNDENDCGCGTLCIAALRGQPHACPRSTEPHPVDLATREPLEEIEPTLRPYDAARSTLETAAEYVAGPRSAHYGHPLDNHTRTADMQTSYLRSRGLLVDGVELTPEDVCYLNVLQKMARDIHVPKPDTAIDVAGYAANVAEIRAERDRRA